MNLQIVVITLFIVLLIIGNEVTKVRRKLNELDEKLGHFQIDSKIISDGLRESLQDVRRDLQKECRDVGKGLREEIRSDLKHEIQMHEIRTGS